MALAEDPRPAAWLYNPEAVVWYPSACDAKPLATEPKPCEWAAVAVAVVPSPMALEQTPVAVLFWLEAKLNGPEAVLFLPWAWA